MKALALALLLAVPASAAKTPDFKIAKVLDAPVSKLDGIGDLKGKVVYLEFWATWCHPCVASIPRMNKIIEAMKGEPIVFLSVTDDSADTVETFLKTHEMKAWVGVDTKRSAFDAFGVYTYPSGYLIDKDGTLLARINPELVKESELRDAVAGKFGERPIEKDAKPTDAAAEPADAALPKEGRSLLSLRVWRGGETKPNMSWGSGRVDGWGMAFVPTLALAWDVPPELVLVDSAPAPFNFSLRAEPQGLAAGREVLKDAIEKTLGIAVVPVKRRVPVFVLTLAKGSAGPKPAAKDAMRGMMAMGGGTLQGVVGMDEAARGLWMNLESPVVNETGLKGDYDLDLSWKFGDAADRDRALASAGLRLVKARRALTFYRVVPAKKR